MALFKACQKTGRSRRLPPSGGEISPLRPAYVPKAPPCSGGCPCGTDIRGWLTTIAQAEALRPHVREEAYRIAWEKITDRNPFPGGLRPGLPAPLRGRLQPQAKRMAPSPSTRWSGSSAISESRTV